MPRASDRDFGKPRGEADRETEDATKVAKEETSNYRSKNGSKKQLSNGPTGGTRPRRIACAAAAIEQEPEPNKHSHGDPPTHGHANDDRERYEREVLHPKDDSGEATRRHQSRYRLSDAGPKLAQFREHS